MKKLAELIENGFGIKEDLNCAEKVFMGANVAYGLGLSNDILKISSGFGGGMTISSACGVCTAAVMVISLMFAKDVSHKDEQLNQLVSLFFSKFNCATEQKTILCSDLKSLFRTPEHGCKPLIVKAAEILDFIVFENQEIINTYKN